MIHPDGFYKEQGPHLLELDAAAALLRAAGVLIYPTETFFAIGCLCTSAAGTAAVFRAKRRPLRRTLPLLAADAAQAGLVVDIEAMPQALLQFWPGPLTVLLPVHKDLPEALHNAAGKAAIRVTSHPLASALARAAGVPLVSSSANISGSNAVSDMRALDPLLLSQVGGILAGCSHTAGGLASTLVEPLGGQHIRLLRAGAITEEMLLRAGWQVTT